jgi:phosphate transport system permease protein
MKTLAQQQKSRARKDLLMSRMVSLFGIGVLATMTLLMWYLFSRTVPLFLDPWLMLKTTDNIQPNAKMEQTADNQMAFSGWFETDSVIFLSALPNKRTVFVGYQNNSLTRWVQINKQGQFHYIPTYRLQLNSEEWPVQLKAHPYANAAFLLTTKQRLIMFNRVTGEQLHINELSNRPLSIQVFSKEIKITYPDKIETWTIKNLAGVTTLKSLFNKQHHEGYRHPKWVYQTASGSDFIDAKYSLIPLFMGSAKVAACAIFIAVPLALGAAVFSGFFAPYHWRNRIKSSIEMLEAVPSVVIGFIAAVLLAPLVETLLVAIGLFVTTLPFIVFLFAHIQQRLSKSFTQFEKTGMYLFLASLTMLAWSVVSFHLAHLVVPLEWFFGASKSTLVVAIALGLAISPTIYTIAEDAIHSVPDALKNASFALGATQLQTLKRVVLRVAKPGLVAAIMLGFGRAVGETMIVLMVSGNTPIADWSLFEGVRAITANLAIEFTEAETGSELYVILFFTATCLFVFTFVCNSFAELLRYRMRKAVQDA